MRSTEKLINSKIYIGFFFQNNNINAIQQY